MSDQEKVEHVLKVIQYIFSKGDGASIVNLNDFFTEMPFVSNGSTHVTLTTTVTINGISVPIRMEVPVHQDLRSFEAYFDYQYFPSNPNRVTWDYGLGAGPRGLQIVYPAQYYELMSDFLYP